MADRVQAWTQVVLAEAAVTYAYGVAGPQVEPALRGFAVAQHDAHKQARDDALLALVAAGGSAPELPTLFTLPGPINTPTAASELLATVESRLAVNYADLIEALPIAEREPILAMVLQANTRALDWGAQAGPWGTTTA